MVLPLWKAVWKFLKIIKKRKSYDTAIPLLCLSTKDLKPESQRETSTPMFTAAEVWIKRRRRVHAVEYYSALKKEILPGVCDIRVNLGTSCWNETSRGKTEPHDRTQTESTEESDTQRQTAAWWLPGARGGANGKLLFNKYKVSSRWIRVLERCWTILQEPHCMST